MTKIAHELGWFVLRVLALAGNTDIGPRSKYKAGAVARIRPVAGGSVVAWEIPT